MRLVHRVEGESHVLASDVEVTRGTLAQMRGLMFRSSIPDDYALAFRFDRPGEHWLHMLFVPFPIDALWIVEDEVTTKKRLEPWTGIGHGTADTVVELPAGAADDVAEGDVVELVAD